ncbi:MAG: hypothetical protein ABI233_06225 [Chthoniobacterales bacterium]
MTSGKCSEGKFVSRKCFGSRPVCIQPPPPDSTVILSEAKDL